MADLPPLVMGSEAPERGMLDLRDERLARCTRCGWEGVPIYVGREASTHCPSCEPTPDNVVPITRAKVSRNQHCPCGSGVKAKRCACPIGRSV